MFGRQFEWGVLLKAVAVTTAGGPNHIGDVAEKSGAYAGTPVYPMLLVWSNPSSENVFGGALQNANGQSAGNRNISEDLRDYMPDSILIRFNMEMI